MNKQVILVIFALIGYCFSQDFKFCATADLVSYSKTHSKGKIETGNITLYMAPSVFSTFVLIEAEIDSKYEFIDKIDMAIISPDLTYIPTSDDKGRIMTETVEEGGSFIEFSFEEAYAVILSDQPFSLHPYTSVFVPTKEKVSGKPIKNWAAGVEWGIDYKGNDEDYQGFVYQLRCVDNFFEECSGSQSLDRYFGTLSSGNEMKVASTSSSCDFAVSGYNGFKKSETLPIVITPYINLACGEYVYVYDGIDASGNVLAVFDDTDNGVGSPLTATTGSFFVDYEGGQGGNGFYIVYDLEYQVPAKKSVKVEEKSVSERNHLSNIDCLVPGMCNNECVLYYSQFAETLLGMTVDNKFDWTTCTSNWSPHCAILAGVIYDTGLCYFIDKRSEQERPAFQKWFK